MFEPYFERSVLSKENIFWTRYGIGSEWFGKLFLKLSTNFISSNCT